MRSMRWRGALLLGALIGLVSASPCIAAERPVYAPPPAWVNEAPLPAASAVRSSEPVEILLRDVHVRVGADSFTAYRRQVMVVNSPTGLQIAGNIQFAWNPAIQTVTIHRLTIHRNAETIDALQGGAGVSILRREQNLDRAMLDGALTVSIQPAGLRVGDVVDLAVTIEHKDPTLQGRAELLTTLTEAPARRVRFRADWPKERTVRWRAAPGAPAVQSFTSADRVGIALDQRDTQPLHIPDAAPPRFYETGYVEIADHPSFASISALIAPLFETAATLPPDSPLHNEIARIRASAPDSAGRALAALRLAQDQVRYFFVGLGDGGYTPASADETWRRRFGDCKAKTALLLAILRGLGIQAEAAIVSTVRNDGLDQRLPMLQSFNHVIVRAVIDGRVYWLDGTRLGDRSLEDANGMWLRWALPLRTSGAELEPLPNTPPSKPFSLVELEVDARGGLYAPAPAQGEMRVRGAFAMALRMQYETLPPQERQDFARAFWASQWKWESVDSATMAFDESSGETVLSIQGKVDLDVEEASAGVRFTVPAANLTGSMPERKPEDGDTPAAIVFPFYMQAHVRIRLPQGGSGFRVDAEPVDGRIGAQHVRRRAVIREGDADIELSVQSLVPEISAADARTAAADIKAYADRRVYVQALRYMYTERDLEARQADGASAVDTRLDRGIALLNRGDNDGARAIFDAILAEQPDSEWALANRGMAHLWRDDLAAAEADFARALALNPSVYVAYLGRGAVHHRRGEYAQAVEAFSTALRISPDNLFARANRAGSYSKLGNHASALEDLRVLVAAAPQEAFLRVGLIQTLAALGREAEARDTLRSLADGFQEGSSEWEDAVMLRSQVATYLGWFDVAVADADALVRRSAAPVPVLAHRCRILASANRNLEQALRDCNRSLSMDPSYDEGYVSRALLRLRRGENDLAIRDFNEALRRNDALAEARYGRGVALDRKGDTAAANADFAAARAIEPEVEEQFAKLGLGPATRE